MSNCDRFYMAEPNYRGKSRRNVDSRDERSIPVWSERMGTAPQRRAYNNYQQRWAVEDNDWSEQRNFEERPDERAPVQPTPRSQRWKEEQKQKRKENKPQKQASTSQEEPKNIPDFRARKETPEAEPSFDLGYYQASIPVKEKYSQNYDHGGFISLVESVYEELLGIDNRVARSMPYSAFLHCMGNILVAHILDVDTSTGGRPLGTAEYVSDLFGAEAQVPAAIYDYLQCYGLIVTAAGDDIWPNLPAAGTFGAIRVADHNKYECYLSPYVTAKRLEASASKTAACQPLPEAYFPQGGLPNENLLGYGPIDVLTPEGRSRISGIRFPEDGSISCRIKFNPDLFQRVQTYLNWKMRMNLLVQIQTRKYLEL